MIEINVKEGSMKSTSRKRVNQFLIMFSLTEIGRVLERDYQNKQEEMRAKRKHALGIFTKFKL